MRESFDETTIGPPKQPDENLTLSAEVQPPGNVVSSMDIKAGTEPKSEDKTGSGFEAPMSSFEFQHPEATITYVDREREPETPDAPEPAAKNRVDDQKPFEPIPFAQDGEAISDERAVEFARDHFEPLNLYPKPTEAAQETGIEDDARRRLEGVRAALRDDFEQPQEEPQPPEQPVVIIERTVEEQGKAADGRKEEKKRKPGPVKSILERIGSGLQRAGGAIVEGLRMMSDPVSLGLIKSRIDRHHKHLESYNRTNARLAEKQEKLEKKIRSREVIARYPGARSNERAHREIEGLRNKLQGLQNEREALANRKSVAETRQAQYLKDRKPVIERTMNRVMERLAPHEEQLNAVMAEKSRLEGLVAEHEHAIAQAENVLEATGGIMDRLRHRETRKLAKIEISANKRRLSVLKKNFPRIDKRVKNIEDRIAPLRSTIADLGRLGNIE